MSFLSDEIERQMEAGKLTGLQVAAKTDVSSTQLYNWINGKQTSISGEQLDALSAALSPHPVDHAKLLVAHLQDERIGKARDMVRIELVAPDDHKDKPRSRSKGEKALEFLACQRQEARSVNELIIDLARVLGADI